MSRIEAWSDAEPCRRPAKAAIVYLKHRQPPSKVHIMKKRPPARLESVRTMSSLEAWVDAEPCRLLRPRVLRVTWFTSMRFLRTTPRRARCSRRSCRASAITASEGAMWFCA